MQQDAYTGMHIGNLISGLINIPIVLHFADLQTYRYPPLE